MGGGTTSDERARVMTSGEAELIELALELARTMPEVPTIGGMNFPDLPGREQLAGLKAQANVVRVERGLAPLSPEDGSA